MIKLHRGNHLLNEPAPAKCYCPKRGQCGFRRVPMCVRDNVWKRLGNQIVNNFYFFHGEWDYIIVGLIHFFDIRILEGSKPIYFPYQMMKLMTFRIIVLEGGGTYFSLNLSKKGVFRNRPSPIDYFVSSQNLLEQNFWLFYLGLRAMIGRISEPWSEWDELIILRCAKTGNIKKNGQIV